ncbi:MAG: LemA family protein [Bacilli bacterium]|jgi:LemA protein|nr:LemA family protein [Bacilli bacterium]MDD2682259.1 LemA family protein [Bacilli bacterium]MDD3121674.1 LemA family protein [Bacilli bacterium]MDD4063627.1 LemA family protein [Bacilli bacterium]MDD4482491.1 LemA family protein [Bacilli bacterium]
MKKMRGKIILIVAVLFVVVIGVSLIVGYNSLVNENEEIDSNFANVNNVLISRHDKITQLVATVNGLQDHAENIYNAITSAREAYAAAQANGTVGEIAEADALESLAITDLVAFMLVEDNPEITATSAYNSLMDEIASTENELKIARKDYNDSVEEYMKSIKKFPKLLYAGIFGFEKQKEYWKINDGQNEIPPMVFGNEE